MKNESITIDDHSISSFVGDAGYHYPLVITNNERNRLQKHNPS